MKCPHCNVTLLMAEKQGVEIDYCPECRGIWLDRGELEKIIEKSPQNHAEPQRTPSYNEDRHYDKHDNNDKHGCSNTDGHYGNKKKQRGNFLADLFDFGD